jgi:PIN domain nuclease of toxin-antitoxin system
MKLLLDTHAFIWWDSKPELLSRRVLTALEDVANDLLISAASLWEIQIKHQAGKMNLNMPLAEIISKHQADETVILPITHVHVLALEDLPNHHKDPFDRILVAQAIVEDATIISKDPLLSQYPIKVIW